MTDHYAEAVEWLKSTPEEYREGNNHRATLCTAMAQVHATLALAEQQRIANLILLAESGRTTVNGARAALAALYTGSAEEGSAHMALRPEIARALRIETP